jgi:hypothetical protein
MLGAPVSVSANAETIRTWTPLAISTLHFGLR